MGTVRRFAVLTLGLAIFASLAVSPAGALPWGNEKKKEAKEQARLAEKRETIDAMATGTMERLLASSERARELKPEAAGWAVFDNTKVSLFLTGGGGRGVAVDADSGRRTYMRMATGGVNVGLGAQTYQVVFLFETDDHLRRFIDSGWDADASANAVAGRKGGNAGASFQNGIAVFQLTEAGLMLQADLSGTKYWKHPKLN